MSSFDKGRQVSGNSIIYLILLLFAGSCNPPEPEVPNNNIVLYESFWSKLRAEYIYMNRVDHESIYREGLDRLRNSDVDSEDTLIACMDRVIERLHDNQLLFYTRNNISQFDPWEGPYDSGPIPSFCRDSTYLVKDLATCWSCHFYSITMTNDRKTFLYYVPPSGVYSIPEIHSFVDSHLSEYIKDGYEGIIVDLRCNNDMLEDYMLGTLIHFLPNKSVPIFYTQTRTSRSNYDKLSKPDEYKVQGKGTCCHIPTALLIDNTTGGLANIMAHVLTEQPNVVTIGMHQTYPSGALNKAVKIGDTPRGRVIALIPYAVVSNDGTLYSNSLQPDILLPAQSIMNGHTDPHILSATQAILAMKEK